MMIEPLSVSVSHLRTTAGHVDDVSSQMKQVLSSLKDQLAALRSPWGDDSIGDQFAKGSSGYLAQVDLVNSVIDNQTQALDSLSQSMSTSANNFEQTDQQPRQALAALPAELTPRYDALEQGSALAPAMPRMLDQLAQPAQPAPGQPPAVARNVLASVVPTGASGLASGFGDLVPIVEALAQPAEEGAGAGVSAAMQAVQTGAPNGSGTPGGPAAPDYAPGDQAGLAAPTK
jgi:uncharacterized protein YukE